MRIRNLDMSFDVNIDFTKDELENEASSREDHARYLIETKCEEQFPDIPNSFTVGIVRMSEYGDDVSVTAVVKA